VTQLSIKVKDHEVRTVNENLGLAIKRLPNGVMRPIMDEATKEASGGYAGGNSYAVPGTGGGYVRTGRYGAGTKLHHTGGQSYRLEQTASYSRYVGGYADGSGQARIHQGRWPKLRDVVSRAAEKIVKAAEEAFREVIMRGPGGL
jgi:hypothetical protein